MHLATKSCTAATILALLTLTACNRAPVYEWHQVEGPDGTFSIALPGDAVKQDTPAKSDGPFFKHSLRVKPSENGAYGCVWWEEQPTPGLTPEQRLDNVRDSGLSSLQGKVLEEKRLTIQGHPARDIRAVVPGHAYDNRIVIVGNRVYSLIVVSRRRDSKNVDKFFQSLVLH